MGNNRFQSSIIQKAPLSVLLLTYNEEHNIGECLDSLGWCDEIWLVDSFSRDRTVEICEQRGAKVVQHEFSGFSSQRNWALDNLPFSHQWVLWVDADERVPKELAQEITEAIAREDNDLSGFLINRKSFFCGKWIKHGGWYPDYNLRQFRRDKVRYNDRKVHERLIVDGRVAKLQTPLLHYSFRNLEDWVSKMNRYTTLEAEMLFASYGEDIAWGKFPQMGFWRSWLSWAKYSFPFLRPFGMFFYTYFLRLGFLDGYYGFLISCLAFFYHAMSLFKTRELSRKKKV